MSLPRMMHADVQFQIYRLEQMAMAGALAFDADEIRNACHLIRKLATELDATAAPVVVGEDAKRLDFIERADYIAMPKGVHIGCCRASIDAAMAASLKGDG